MSNLGKQEEAVSKVAETPQKKVIRFPDVRIDTSQIKSVKECTIGEKYVLTFVAEVKGTRKPETYDNLDKSGVIVDFSLIEGTVRPYRKDKSGKEI
jgi:hypothetical protein